MTTLFDPLTIGGMELKNRIIMAPMTRSRADEAGVVGDITATYYAQRASAGLIITEATNISPMAKGYVRTPGIYTDAQIAAWRKIPQAVHDAGGKIYLQLFHTGRIALPDFLPDGSQPVAPSAIAAKGQNYTDAGMKDFVTPRALNTEEISGIVADFGQAAQNAITAGFDGVELHGASGYLIQQFLTTNANQRTDKYGSSPENRVRFLLETIDAMTGTVGANRVGIKLSPQMPFNDVQEDDAETLYPYLVEQLSSKGLAYLHVGKFNATDWHALLRPLYKGVYFAGAGLDKNSGNALIAAGKADAAVFGTLFVPNPDLPERFRRDASLNPPDKATFYGGDAHGYIDYPALNAV